MTKPQPRPAPQSGAPAPDAPPGCPACAGRPLAGGFASAVPGFRILRCPGCGLGRTWPEAPPAELERWYGQSYYGRENVRFNRAFELLTRLFRRRRARLLDRLAGRGPVLDVGCGRGIMLDHLRRLGYETHGLERSEVAAWHARHELGLDVAAGDFLSSPHRPQSYRVVILWHSLEHLPDPVAALARARDLLMPGGLLAVAVPNFDSVQARLFGRHWFHLDVPRHAFHLGRRSLEALLAAQGLRVVRTDHFCLEQNPFGWVQSLYNALGWPGNLLYDCLKAPSARAGIARRHPWACVLALALLPLLVPLALLLTALDAALEQGGTIEVYAIKQ